MQCSSRCVGEPTLGEMDASTSSTSSESRSWEARPGLARGLRIVVLCGPILMAFLSSIIANRLLPRGNTTPQVLLRLVPIMLVSTAVVWLSDKVGRRLLPLAVLMQLSLVFPDRAPSRLKAALKSGSSRRLTQLVAETRTNGLSADPGEAARQVVNLIGAVGDHDRRTRGHSERVRLYAEMIGQELRLSTEERQKLQWGALLHDLGKLMVPPEILNKVGAPDAREWEVIRTHPMEGMRLVEPLREFLGEWAEAIGGHHERWDGAGYPRQLRAEQIPRAAAIVAVADSVEVMTAVRSYKKAMSASAARAELTRCAGTHFSPEVVRAFLSISLGRVRLIAGPLAALSQAPYVGQLLNIPSAAAAVPAAVGNATVPIALAAVVSAMNVVPASSPVSKETVVVQAAASAGAEPRQLGGLQGEPGIAGEESPPAGESAAESAGEVVQVVDESVDPVTTTTLDPSAPTVTSIVEGPPTSEGSTTPPTSTSSTSSSVPTSGVTQTPTSTTEVVQPMPAGRLTLMVSTSRFHLNAKPLDGASFPAGSSVYVFAKSTGDTVAYAFPGGTHTSWLSPYDMMGRGLLGPRDYVIPSVRGTYTITATVTGNGDPGTLTVTFSSV